MWSSKTWQMAVLSGAVLVTAGSAWAEDMAASAPQAEHKEHAKGEGDRPRRDGERPARSEGDRARRGEEMRKRIHEGLFQGVTLTEDQQVKVKEVMQKARTDREAWMQEHGEEMRKIRTQMREARESGDEQAGKDARAALEALMKDAPRPERYYDEVKALLTEEQAAVFATNAENMRQRWRDRAMGGGPGGPGGAGGPDKPDGERRRPRPDGERRPSEPKPEKAPSNTLDI